MFSMNIEFDANKRMIIKSKEPEQRKLEIKKQEVKANVSLLAYRPLGKLSLYQTVDYSNYFQGIKLSFKSQGIPSEYF